MGNTSLAKIPDVAHDHLEEDASALLNTLGAHYHPMIFRCLNWIETLGRMDMTHSAVSLSRFSIRPREGCLTRVLRVAGFLNKCPNVQSWNLELVYDPTEMHQTKNRRAAKIKELMV